MAHPVVPPRPVTAKEKKGSLFFCKRPTRLESGGEVGVETLAGGAKNKGRIERPSLHYARKSPRSPWCWALGVSVECDRKPLS